MKNMESPQVPLQRTDFGRVSVYCTAAGHGKYPDGNQVLIRGTDTRAAFDTPLVSNLIGDTFDVTELVVMGHVHEDHVAGLHRLPDACVYVHEADLPALHGWDAMAAAYGCTGEQAKQVLEKFVRDFYYTPRPDALGYTDGASWDLGKTKIRAFHMPGHTAGHSVLLVEPEGVAFIGDIDLTGFGPYYGDPGSNLRDFRRTLAKLPEIPAKVWVTSHHRGIYTDRALFLEDLARFSGKLNEREQRLLEWLAQGPQTIEQLAQRRLLYPPHVQGWWVQSAEERTVLQHLEELIEAGRVRIDETGMYWLT